MDRIVRFCKSMRLVVGVLMILFWLSGIVVAFIAPTEQTVTYRMSAGGIIGMLIAGMGTCLIAIELDEGKYANPRRWPWKNYRSKEIYVLWYGPR